MGYDMTYAPVSGPCAACDCTETCCDHRGTALCQDCWHAAREAESAYAVFRVEDGMLWSDGAYVREEAEADATRRNEQAIAAMEGRRADALAIVARIEREKALEGVRMRLAWSTYEARPCGQWFGNRMAHPGYLDHRRHRIAATDPELN